MGMTWAYGPGDEKSGLATIAQESARARDDVVALTPPRSMARTRMSGLSVVRSAGRRDEFEIATKFGFVINPDVPSDRTTDGSPENVQRACEASLERLGVDHIDLFYQHRVNPNVPIEETVAGRWRSWLLAGKVRFLGLLEASAETIRRAHATHPITAVQSEYSLWTRNCEDEVLATLRELGIGMVAYSPLGRGFLTGQIRSLDDLPQDDWRRSNPRFEEQALRENL